MWLSQQGTWKQSNSDFTALRSVYTERDRERGLAAFAKEWSK